jgi:hypothetical protein
MAARLGIFLGWIFTSVALVLAAFGAWLVSKHSTAPMTDLEFLFICATFGTGAVVWLLGRGIRFVLAGPKQSTHVSGFVERFADPNVPIRKPSGAARQPGPWGTTELATPSMQHLASW